MPIEINTLMIPAQNSDSLENLGLPANDITIHKAFLPVENITFYSEGGIIEEGWEDKDITYIDMNNGIRIIGYLHVDEFNEKYMEAKENG